MATDDVQVLVTGQGSAPQQFTIPGNGQIQPKAIRAVYNGTAAASPFLPVLKIISDGGIAVAECVAPSIAAGGSAAVSWFPHVKQPTTGAGPSPNPLGTLFAWFDFADTTTITLDGANRIRLILDKTGNGHDAVQTTAGNRPAETTVNGLNAGLFASARPDVLISGPWEVTLAQPYTVACVFTQDVGGAVNYFPGPYGGPANPPPPILFESSNGAQINAQQGNQGIGTGLASPFTQQQTTAIYNGASSTLRLNGVAHAGTVDVDVAPMLVLGAAHYPVRPPLVEQLDGKLCEVLVYQDALTAAQLVAVEAYLKAKWNTP